MTYLKTDPAGWIVGVWPTDPEIEGAIEFPDWPGWTPPAPGQRPRLVDGAVVWQDPRSLDDLKAAKNAEINAARLAANRSGFSYGGKTFAADELSRSDIDAVQAIVARTGSLPAGWPGGWKAVDNTVAPLGNVAAWDAFYAAMYQTGLANFVRSQTLKTQLEAATTAEQVAAIAW